MKSTTKNNAAKAVGAVASVTMLATAGVAYAAPATQDAVVGEATVEAASLEQGAPAIVSEADVRGTFAFTQDELTPNQTIATMFMRAATSLCASTSTYAVDAASAVIAVGGDVPASFSATVDEMADQAGDEAFVLACACASNGPGGGAVANAEVEGVSLAGILAQAGVTEYEG